MSSRLACALLGLALWPAWSSAQTQEVRGRIIDGAGQPVADQAVLLHRVIGSSGANIAQARSDSAGHFLIAADTTGGTQATYFLAARWNDELYISEAFQAPFGAAERVLQVGVPGTSASALLEGNATTTPRQLPAAAPPGGAPASAARWLLFAVPALSLLGLGAYLVLRNRGALPERRRMLARIARLDLEQAGMGSESFRAERARLLGRLRELTGP
jgi:hypothetical protein